jgi:hypothetical protein
VILLAILICGAAGFTISVFRAEDCLVLVFRLIAAVIFALLAIACAAGMLL